MYRYKYCLIILTINSVFSYTFENVTINLTKNPLGTPETHWNVFDEPPRKQITIKNDNQLRKYIINETLQDIVIWGQKLPELPTNSIRNLSETHQIVINYCNLKVIESKAIRNLPNLQVLDLKMNEISEIKNGVFNGLNISYLYLNDNKIMKIGLRAFQNMTKLKSLQLNKNRISVWYYQWLIGSSLQSLYMSSNLIEKLYSDSFDFLQNHNRGNQTLIDAIDFSNNQLINIEIGAFRFIDKVKYLNFDDNRLGDIDSPIFQGVKNIHILKLNNNTIAQLDQIAFEHIEIQYFYLQNNHLECLNKNLIKMIKIRRLFLDGNPIHCDCVRLWQEWKDRNRLQWKRKPFPIDNFEDFQEKCVV